MTKIDWGKWKEIDISGALPKTGDCRYCEHHTWQHRFDSKLGGYPCFENPNLLAKCTSADATTILIPTQNVFGQCPCMNYVPGDNLAYLEWKFRKENP